MEDPGIAEGLGWLRLFSHSLGEDGICSGAAAMEISEVCYLK
jgi:hypothetical protein